MIKFNRIFLLVLVLIFLSTYNPSKFHLVSKKDNNFFNIQNIKITNNFFIKENEFQKKLTQLYNKNIFLIKRKEIEASLETIDFLEKIEVKKKYPSTIIIKVFETKHVAILFKNKKKYLLDSSSNLILFKDEIINDELPEVFGEGAKNNFVDFFKQLKKNNFPNQKIKNFYYFQIGRWDLQLIDNKIIKFPHNSTDDIIKKSIELLNREDFQNYNIIDLRVVGKIIVE